MTYYSLVSSILYSPQVNLTSIFSLDRIWVKKQNHTILGPIQIRCDPVMVLTFPGELTSSLSLRMENAVTPGNS